MVGVRVVVGGVMGCGLQIGENVTCGATGGVTCE